MHQEDEHQIDGHPGQIEYCERALAAEEDADDVDVAHRLQSFRPRGAAQR